jgi:group I intron endonuclease
MGLVYHIFNPINGKCYIGQTRRSLAERWRSHKSPSSGCRKLRNAIAEYGADNFIVTTLVSGLDNDSDLTKAEAYWISYFDSINNGYNLTCGGQGHPLSDETKRLLSRLNSGPNHPLWGKRLPFYPRRAGIRRRGWPNHTHEAIRKAIVCNETGERFESVSLAALALGVPQPNISKVLHGHRNTVQGFSFKFI